MKRAFATLLACTLVAAYAQATNDDDDDERSIDRRQAADPAGEVDISNVSGSVTVSGWDRSEVHVSGTLARGVEELQFETTGKRTVVKVVLRRGSHRGGGDTDLNIRVPRKSSLSVNTVSADISAVGIEGQIDLQAVSGDVSADITGADAEVKAVSGDVSLRGDGKPGVLIVTTVSGTARVNRVAGEITASTVSGEIDLNADKVSRARLNTTSGDISFRGSVTPNVKIDAETISGQLTLDLEDVHAQFDIESFSGEIESCTGPEARRTHKYGPGSELRFTHGKGTGRITVHSLSGEISVCPR
jgi:Putative adhesin